MPRGAPRRDATPLFRAAAAPHLLAPAPFFPGDMDNQGRDGDPYWTARTNRGRQHGGWTAIQAAALSGSLEMVRTLLQHGADPHLAGDGGKTAFDFASEHPEVLALLEVDQGGC